VLANAPVAQARYALKASEANSYADSVFYAPADAVAKLSRLAARQIEPYVTTQGSPAYNRNECPGIECQRRKASVTEPRPAFGEARGRRTFDFLYLDAHPSQANSEKRIDASTRISAKRKASQSADKSERGRAIVGIVILWGMYEIRFEGYASHLDGQAVGDARGRRPGADTADSRVAAVKRQKAELPRQLDGWKLRTRLRAQRRPMHGDAK
jgi:hypothetical protein